MIVIALLAMGSASYTPFAGTLLCASLDEA
jgi:hypothetical protein